MMDRPQETDAPLGFVAETQPLRLAAHDGVVGVHIHRQLLGKEFRDRSLPGDPRHQARDKFARASAITDGADLLPQIAKAPVAQSRRVVVPLNRHRSRLIGGVLRAVEQHTLQDVVVGQRLAAMVQRLENLVCHFELHHAHPRQRHLVEQPHHEARALLRAHVGEVVVHVVDRSVDPRLALRAGMPHRIAHRLVLPRGAALLHEAPEEGIVDRVERDAPLLLWRGEGHGLRLCPDHALDQDLLVL